MYQDHFHYEHSCFLESDSDYLSSELSESDSHSAISFIRQIKARTRTPLLVPLSSTPPFWPLKALAVTTIPVVFDQPLFRINRIQMHLALIQFASALSCLSFAVSKVTSETQSIRSSFIL